MPPRIKFCGLQTPEDVAVACAAGAWAVGFVLTEGPRRVSVSACRELAQTVPEGVTKVGVFTHEPPKEIREAVDACGLDLVQVHVEALEDPQAYAGLPLVRAFRVRGPETLRKLAAVRGELFLLDAYVRGRPGGTGASFDWTLARRAAAYGRVILAGGLTPENVAEAVRTARPWAVDVSSGVERTRGVKDHDRMRAFAQAVRGARISERG